LQGSGLVAVAIGAMNVFDGQPTGFVLLDQAGRKRMRFVRRIVENLNLQQFARYSILLADSISRSMTYCSL